MSVHQMAVDEMMVHKMRVDKYSSGQNESRLKSIIILPNKWPGKVSVDKMTKQSVCRQNDKPKCL